MVEARRILLDALETLATHRASLVLVGAQAVYLRTEGVKLPYSTSYTTDADLTVNPLALRDAPPIQDLMRAAGSMTRQSV